MHKDRYVVLQASTFAEEKVDPDLFFDRFRWAELSLGFSYTGDSDGKVIPLSLWEINDATHDTIEDLQTIRAHLTVRSKEDRFPLRPLFAVWDSALPVSALSALHSISMSANSDFGVPPIPSIETSSACERSVNAYEQDEPWASSVKSLEQTISRHHMKQRGKITAFSGGKEVSKEAYYAESFRPALISSAFETILHALPQGEDWRITATSSTTNSA